MLGCFFHHGGRQFQAGLAIHIGMMEANQHGETVGRYTFYIVHALNNVDLPRRTLHIDTAGHGARSKDTQLTPVTRLRQPYMTNVILQIEILIIQPVRIVQLERCLFQPATEERGGIQSVRNVLQDFLMSNQPTWRAALITQPETTNHHGLIGRLKVKEVRVHRGELFHFRNPRTG